MIKDPQGVMGGWILVGLGSTRGREMVQCDRPAAALSTLSDSMLT